MSGLFSAIVIFMTWQTPSLKSPKSECSCWSGWYVRTLYTWQYTYRCGEMVAHSTFSPNTGWTSEFKLGNANKQTKTNNTTLLMQFIIYLNKWNHTILFLFSHTCVHFFRLKLFILIFFFFFFFLNIFSFRQCCVTNHILSSYHWNAGDKHLCVYAHTWFQAEHKLSKWVHTCTDTFRS